jgi:hypothetical protein
MKYDGVPVRPLHVLDFLERIKQEKYRDHDWRESMMSKESKPTMKLARQLG